MEQFRSQLNYPKLFASLLIGSALSLSFGGILLYAFNQVPIFLIYLTSGAVVALYILAYFVSKGKMLAINISTVLGVFAPVLSASTPEHLNILSNFGRGWLISADGLLQFLGFYVFPITFVAMRFVFRKKLGKKIVVPAAQTERFDAKTDRKTPSTGVGS